MSCTFRSAFWLGAVLSLVVSGCVSRSGQADAETAAPPVLRGAWTLVELEGERVRVASGQRAPTLELNADHDRVAGFGGVNQFAGTFTTSRDTVALGSLLATKMAGPSALNELETNYLRALESANRWRIANDELMLLNEEKVVARFVAREQE
jgi:heat shock protein HslJ